jgi:hypothetical protein
MLKPGKTYNMTKSTKRILAQFPNAHERGQWKRMMIDAELSAAIIPKTTKKERPNGPAGTTGSHAYTTAE